MARVDMRTVANKSGVTYDATQTTIIFAEDVNTVKTAIDDASTGVNTQQLEVGGVTVINSSGEIQNGTGVTPHKETKLGSNCSGVDGAANRVLTLSNTKTTKVVTLLVSGIGLHETIDYTVSHLSTSSTITFLNAVWDIMNIEVIYFS